MKSYFFTEDASDHSMSDFVLIQDKSQLNESVFNIQRFLKERGISVRTNNLKNLLAQSAGFNSSNHLISKLPVAFIGIHSLINLCILINKNTPHNIFLEPIIYYDKDVLAEKVDRLKEQLDSNNGCKYLFIERLDEQTWLQLSDTLDGSIIENLIIQKYLSAFFPLRKKTLESNFPNEIDID